MSKIDEIVAMLVRKDERIAALEDENRRLKEVLQEALLQIEYMQQKFQPTGTGNSVISLIKTVLAQ